MKTIKLTLYIAVLAYGLNWLYTTFKPKAIQIANPGKAVVKISADSIRAICEMNGASQQVTVLFDTSFVTQTPDVMFFGLSLLKRDQLQRYSEQRIWQIKAGTDHIDVASENGKPVIELSYPKILTSQELDEQFRILHSTVDNWSPVHQNLHVARSRRLAESKALRAGIAHRAALSIEDALRKLISNNVEIKWLRQ